MSKGAVRLRHTMGVFALLHRGAAVVRRVQQFGAEAVGHGLLRTAAGGLVIEAPPETASTLAALFSGMAQLLQQPAVKATPS